MKEKINSYFAVLLITLFGSGATLLIVHVVYANTLTVVIAGSEGNYAPLQQSILKP